ncbi:hypothetical protein [Hutsoniella sourekii]|uniref:hypothetical protein n=1 Tax=Hutsoniella sourekii TaxID=87650 RepID=UPI0004828FA8|nr:hypothetical protein [Hutsoniella sourekii]
MRQFNKLINGLKRLKGIIIRLHAAEYFGIMLGIIISFYCFVQVLPMLNLVTLYFPESALSSFLSLSLNSFFIFLMGLLIIGFYWLFVWGMYCLIVFPFLPSLKEKLYRVLVYLIPLSCAAILLDVDTLSLVMTLVAVIELSKRVDI